mgnify:CR=1 FL=1
MAVLMYCMSVRSDLSLDADSTIACLLSDGFYKGIFVMGPHKVRVHLL